MAKEAEVFDLIVIGAGPGGLRAAIIASIQGRKTLLVESGELGGICVNVGCIPVKSMLNASAVYHDATHDLDKFGISISKPKVNFKKMMAKVHGIVKADQDDIKKSINNKNLTLVKERASFTGKNTIKAGSKEYFGKKILIATGAKPHVPTIKGIEKVKYKLSDDALSLQKLPKSVIMIGGGYISVELSTFFNDLGSKVTILEKTPSLLSNFDSDVSLVLEQQYSKEGVSVNTGVDILEVKQSGKNKTVNYVKNGKKLKVSAEELFVIAGRSPNTFGLNLESAGVKKGERGEVVVNEKLQTSNPDIFAIGDVTARSFFANIAQKEGEYVMENMFSNTSKSYNSSMVPWATGTRPRLAHIGVSENEAKKKNMNVRVLKANIADSAGGEVLGYKEGFVKVIIDKESKKLLGCTILSPRSETMIHEYVALLKMNATLDDIKGMMHVHPTLSEVFDIIH